MNDIQINEEIKNFTVRQGYLYKRSRFKKEWRRRWIVLTLNFLFTFQAESKGKVTQIIELREITAYTSQLRKTEETISNCFSIHTRYNEFAFCADPQDVCAKWSWIVTLQRLVDFLLKGASSYNSMDMIKTKGFFSCEQYEFTTKFKLDPHPEYHTISPQYEKSKMLLHADEILNKLIEQQKLLNNRLSSVATRQGMVQSVERMYENQKQQLHLQRKQNDRLKHEIKTMQMKLAEQKQIHENQIKKDLQAYTVIQKNIWKWYIFSAQEINQQLLEALTQQLHLIYKKAKVISKQQTLATIKTLCEMSDSGQLTGKYNKLVEALERRDLQENSSKQ